MTYIKDKNKALQKGLKIVVHWHKLCTCTFEEEIMILSVFALLSAVKATLQRQWSVSLSFRMIDLSKQTVNLCSYISHSLSTLILSFRISLHLVSLMNLGQVTRDCLGFLSYESRVFLNGSRNLMLLPDARLYSRFFFFFLVNSVSLSPPLPPPSNTHTCFSPPFILFIYSFPDKAIWLPDLDRLLPISTLALGLERAW